MMHWKPILGKMNTKTLLLCVIKATTNGSALIFETENELCINLKCYPDLIPVLKDQYPAVKSAWHMNKKHWCTVQVNHIPDETLDELIKISFDITGTQK